MRGTTAIALTVASVLVLGIATAPSSARPRQQGTTYLDNGLVRVGVSLDEGAKITFAGLAGGSSTNLVQDVQPSYYSGPSADGRPGWHAFGTGGTVLASSNDGRTIYTKTRAAQEFAGPCECVFEQWVRLSGRAILVRNRLSVARADATRYDALGQELPALYTTGGAYRVFTYDGTRPYTGAALREITEDAGNFFRPGPSWLATERWAAAVGDDGFGIGLFKRDLVRFSGIPGTRAAVTNDWVNGYLTASTPEILDANQVYEYSYTLVVGSLRQIRAYTYDHRPDGRPSYRFRFDRQHWWYPSGTDRGWPIRGALRVLGGPALPELRGPEGWWRASAVPVVYVRGRWGAGRPQIARMRSYSPTSGEVAGDALFVPIRDDQFHTYRLDLRGPGYAGWITGLGLEPIQVPESSSEIDITCISWRPCPVDRRAEAATVGSGPVPYLDSFIGPTIDQAFWHVDGTGPSVTQTDGQLEIDVLANAQPDPATRAIRAGATGRCVLHGDFDAQVDYRLLDWPEANGVHLSFGTTFPQAIGRQNLGGDVVFAWFPPSVVNLPLADLSGSLRLVRHGATITGFVRSAGGWTRLLTAPDPYDDTQLQLSISALEGEWAHRRVRVAFDNFRVSTGRLSCS